MYLAHSQALCNGVPSHSVVLLMLSIAPRSSRSLTTCARRTSAANAYIYTHISSKAWQKPHNLGRARKVRDDRIGKLCVWERGGS